MKTNLEDTISTALTEPVTAAHAAAVLAEAQAAMGATQTKVTTAMDRALDPKSTASVAARAKAEADDLAFAHTRLARAVDALSDRLAELQAKERKAAKDAELNAALAERDTIAARLKERGPLVLAELVEMLHAIRDNDDWLERVGGMTMHGSAEAIARGCPGNFSKPSPGAGLSGPRIPRLLQMEIPAWDGRGNVWDSKIARAR